MRIDDLNPADRAAVQLCPLVSHLPEPAFVPVLNRARVTDLKRGEYLLNAGQTADYLYIVLDGWVQLTRIDASGKSHVIAVFSRGESLAEAIAFVRGKYPASAQAMTDARVLAIRGESFLDAMQSDRSVLGSGLAAIYRHLHYLVDEVDNLKSRTIRQRVARFLARLSPKSEGSATIALPFEKSMLAAKIGTSPENLSRTLAAMADIGISVHRNSVNVEDMDRLIEVAGLRDDPR